MEGVSFEDSNALASIRISSFAEKRSIRGKFEKQGEESVESERGRGEGLSRIGNRSEMAFFTVG